MASRKRQEDKNLKALRELTTQPHNKKCFDCGQRGPTYVNMTIGVFVCTSCSGLLRGLNPPHRIKSISMASFNHQEIEFLQKHGNEVCGTVWLALWDKVSIGNESREGEKMKDHLVHKYERKAWYSEQKVPPPRPPPPSVNHVVETPVAAKPQMRITVSGSNLQSAFVAPPGAAEKPTLIASAALAQIESPKSQVNTNIDFPTTFSNDPFTDDTPTPSIPSFTQPAAEQNSAPFFDAFTSSDDSKSHDSFDTFVHSRPNQPPPPNITLLNTTATTASQVDASTSGDKYAALAGLDMNNVSPGIFSSSSMFAATPETPAQSQPNPPQSVFSSSSLFGSFPEPGAQLNVETSTRSQLNPFASSNNNSIGGDGFQQQTKPANPFLSSGTQSSLMTSQTPNLFYPPAVDANNNYVDNVQTSMYKLNMANTVGMATSTSMVSSNPLNSNFLISGRGSPQLNGQQPSTHPNRSAVSANSIFPNQTSQGFADHFNTVPNEQTFPRQQHVINQSQNIFPPQTTNQNQYSFGDAHSQPSSVNNHSQAAMLNSPFQPFHSNSGQMTKNHAAIQDQWGFGTNNNTPVNTPIKSTNPFM